MQSSDIQSWYSKYVGIPWERYGFSEKGLDCYNLIRWVLLHEKGIFIEKDAAFHANNSPSEYWYKDVEANPWEEMDKYGWVRVTGVIKPFDCITVQLPKHDQVSHCGLYIEGGFILHTHDPKSKLGIYIPGNSAYNRTRGVWRWKDLM